METWLPLIAGLILLVIGGELLVRGAVKVASNLGVSPLVIGLTLVGFGTSSPELVTSVQAALSGSPGIAFGNIVGSNMANLLLILGVSALITPIAIASGALRRDGAVMVAATIVFVILALVMPLGRAVGLAFVAALAVYIYTAFRQESSGSADHGAAHGKSAAAQGVDPGFSSTAGGSTLMGLVTAIAGLAIVVGGGYLLVNGAVAIARSYGISETVIGLTIVAVGTSMPELVTSLVAAFRKQADVAFGNIIGSNIYNILGIGGVTVLIAPSEVPAEIANFDNYIMIGASLLVLVLAYTGRRIARWEGALLLAGYIAYIALLWPTGNAA
ncbi:calcium/sodium antiporter [Mesorhizobium sp. YIM 152430]|jgi:cation:H+ antiporter|uniref:calcium/sodium antiporter n=1 Tax=Mesorhizobium sp. YIM 152430 TaxID=3031761 RepID=UPI0023DBFD94|nr:calcium/sodium antiporter [Mesorhizobium sp. YIM 152430]MDF1601610.1 calcium/sodium antiporter [Mesorhizobium sp. YIM 152430]